jgi:proteic killer suppression protein
MIRSYRSKAAEAIMEGRRPKGFGPDVIRSAKRRLVALDAAISLDDLRANPGNRLELLKGDRKGQHSIRVNDQYRICFRWHENDAEDVEIVDYH